MLLAAASVATVAAGVSLAGSGIPGVLSQQLGTQGCISEDTTGGECQDGRALDQAMGLALTGDVDNLYVASTTSDGVVAFKRDKKTGQIRLISSTNLQLACVTETGTGGDCQDGRALDGAIGVAASQDNKTVYVASNASDAVAVFVRNVFTGVLTQSLTTDGCTSDDGTGGTCVDGRLLDGADAVAVSGDGKSVYVGGTDGIAVFSRNTKTGNITQVLGINGCISNDGTGATCIDGFIPGGITDLVVSKDGASVYAVSNAGDALLRFDRNKSSGVLTIPLLTAKCISEDGSGGECVNGYALDGANGLALSNDGKNAYVASTVSDAVATFARAKNGPLTEVQCVSDDGSGGACVDGLHLDAASNFEVPSNGKQAWLTTANGLASFNRNKKDGTLTQLAPVPNGCFTEDGSGGDCGDGKALDGAYDVVSTSSGKDVYATAATSDAIVALKHT